MEDSDLTSSDNECIITRGEERELGSFFYSDEEEDYAELGGEKDLASLLLTDEEDEFYSEPELESPTPTTPPITSLTANTSPTKLDDVATAGGCDDDLKIKKKKKKLKRRTLSIAQAFRTVKKGKKQLAEFRHRVEESIQNANLFDEPQHRRTSSSSSSTTDEAAGTKIDNNSSSNNNHVIRSRHKSLSSFSPISSPSEISEISLWGVPLLPSKSHPGTDVILEKFLKAQDYSVTDALAMLRRTLLWRRREGIDKILDEDIRIGEGMERVVFIDKRTDRDGRPICFNMFGALRDADLQKEGFGSTAWRKESFLRWRFQFMEKGIRWKLKFGENGGGGGGVADSFLQIADFRNAPGKELAAVGMKALWMLEEHYPEITFKHIIINAPFWYYMLHGLLSKKSNAGTRKKFIFARPNKLTETLLKFIAPQDIPVEYGGLWREDDEEFTSDDKVLEIIVKSGQTAKIEFPVNQAQVTMVWDIMLVGVGIIYKEEFIPEDEGSYKVLIQEKKDVGSVMNSFYINEPGKIVITMRNSNYHRRGVFCRYKCKSTPVSFVHKSSSSS